VSSRSSPPPPFLLRAHLDLQLSRRESSSSELVRWEHLIWWMAWKGSERLRYDRWLKELHGRFKREGRRKGQSSSFSKKVACRSKSLPGVGFFTRGRGRAFRAEEDATGSILKMGRRMLLPGKRGEGKRRLEMLVLPDDHVLSVRLSFLPYQVEQGMSSPQVLSINEGSSLHSLRCLPSRIQLSSGVDPTQLLSPTRKQLLSMLSSLSRTLHKTSSSLEQALWAWSTLEVRFFLISRSATRCFFS